MERLALEPGAYSGSYKLIGGRISLDLVNTISWPETDRRHDWLDTSDNVTRWLDAIGLPGGRVTEDDLIHIWETREIISDMLRPIAHGQHPPKTASGRFNQCLTRATTTRLIDPVTLDWTWRPAEDGRDLLAPVVIDAADLITDDDHSRLKYCPSCDWIFEDQTRNGQRRWCDMADCGSRAKSRSYYERKSKSDS